MLLRGRKCAVQHGGTVRDVYTEPLMVCAVSQEKHVTIQQF